MGYGQYSNDYHKPFTKRELLETARAIESRQQYGESDKLPLDWLKDSRLIAKNTLRYTIYNPAGIANESIVYHKTRILVLEYDNRLACRPLLSVLINTGGFNTMTTRERLNRFLPSGWSVFTDKGVLFIRTPAGTYPNCDGALYYGNGMPCEPDLHKDSRAMAIADKRAIDAFCKAITPDNLPMPSNGDPFIFDWNPKAIGDDVLRDWLESKYVNGALIVHAMRRKGWTDTALSMAYHRPVDFMPQVRRACRDFFKAGLGLA